MVIDLLVFDLHIFICALVLQQYAINKIVCFILQNNYTEFNTILRVYIKYTEILCMLFVHFI